MTRSSRVWAVVAMVAAVGLVALGVAYGRGGEGSSGTGGDLAAVGPGTEGAGYPPPTRTADPFPRTATPAIYPEPSATLPVVFPTLAPDYFTLVAALTEEASWTVTPTPTPAPPTATPTRLPTLPAETSVVLYPTCAGTRVQIVRMAVDGRGNPMGAAYPAGPSWGGREQVTGLYACPDGRHVAVGWQYGNGPGIGLLDVSDGEFTKRFVPGVPYFLAWSRDGSKMLSHSGSGGPPYRLYLVDAETGEYREIEVPPLPDGYRGQLDAATFSPDGRSVLVVHSGPDGQETEVWRLALYDGAEPERLYRTEEAQISHVSYSPDGEEIAFVAGDRRAGETMFRDGHIWVMRADGSDARPVTRAVMLPYDSALLAPIWLGDGEWILYVRAEEGGLADTWDGLRTNLYRVEVASGRAKPVTEVSGAAVLLGGAAPGGGEVLALVRASSAGAGGYRPWVVNPQTGEAVRVEGWEVDNGRSFYGPVMAWMTVVR